MIEKKEKIRSRAGEVVCHTDDHSAHKIRWTEWGDETNPRILFCAHGLSRNGRDFDYLARVAADNYRVICPDYPGRGNSDSFVDPSYYHNQQYLLDTLQILDSLKFDQLHWVGTSMGGLIGMGLASMPDQPIGRLVVNDVGAFIPGEALAMINAYLREHPTFESLQDAENYFRHVYAGFGPLRDDQYRHLVEHGVKPSEHGYVLNHDTEMIDQFTALPCDDIALWDLWEKIDVPTLILRGEKSGLLLRSTVEEMKARHKGAVSEEIEGCAHAPSLMVEDQIELVLGWLQR